MSETHLTAERDHSRGVNVKLPDGPRRIWPAAENRTHIACDHWTADPDHLGRGACALGLFGGVPVLGHCLLRCSQYTGTAEQREAQREDMYRKYARPGEWEFVRARELSDQAAKLDTGAERDALIAEAIEYAEQGRAVRPGPPASAYVIGGLDRLPPLSMPPCGERHMPVSTLVVERTVDERFWVARPQNVAVTAGEGLYPLVQLTLEDRGGEGYEIVLDVLAGEKCEQVVGAMVATRPRGLMVGEFTIGGVDERSKGVITVA